MEIKKGQRYEYRADKGEESEEEYEENSRDDKTIVEMADNGLNLNDSFSGTVKVVEHWNYGKKCDGDCGTNCNRAVWFLTERNLFPLKSLKPPTLKGLLEKRNENRNR